MTIGENLIVIIDWEKYWWPYCIRQKSWLIICVCIERPGQLFDDTGNDKYIVLVWKICVKEERCDCYWWYWTIYLIIVIRYCCYGKVLMICNIHCCSMIVIYSSIPTVVIEGDCDLDVIYWPVMYWKVIIQWSMLWLLYWRWRCYCYCYYIYDYLMTWIIIDDCYFILQWQYLFMVQKEAITEQDYYPERGLFIVWLSTIVLIIHACPCYPWRKDWQSDLWRLLDYCGIPLWWFCVLTVMWEGEGRRWWRCIIYC